MAMDLQKLSEPLLESLVAVVVTLDGAAATVAGPERDVLLTKPPKSLSVALDTFIIYLRDTLGHDDDTPLGEALANLQATPEATWDSVINAASAWQYSVAIVWGKWIQITREAIEALDACRVTASTKGDIADDIAKQAKDLQDKKTNWLNSLEKQMAKTWQLPWVTDEEKADKALEEYNDKVEKAKKKTLLALSNVVDTAEANSRRKAAIKSSQRAKVAVKPLEGLVEACSAATEMFQELSRKVGEIKDDVERTKETSPNVPKGLKAKVEQAEELWRASSHLDDRLDAILGDISICIQKGPGSSGDPSGRTVAEKCEEAKKAIPGLLKKVMSP